MITLGHLLLLIFSTMDVYVVGYIKLVNGQSLINRSVLDEVEIATIRSLLYLENILSGSKKNFNVLIIFCLMLYLIRITFKRKK